MKKKFIRHAISLLLVLGMIFGSVNVNADANPGSQSSDNDFYRIYHLDAGRKYFSVSQIENMIDLLASNHYTHMELALGNDALRFVLDDMSVTANGTTYASEKVTEGIAAGNASYYDDPNGSYLTQGEMDTILAYAKSRGIEIIPLINSPGHMNAILDCMNDVGIEEAAYHQSEETVDVTNEEAANFTLAFVDKYIQYFAGQGVKIFNLGADEYANDVYTKGSMGFGHLIESGEYDAFIDYVNRMTAQIQKTGMTAMAFNDGIYFQNNTSSGTLNSQILIAYWTSGWGSYAVRSAQDLAEDGFRIINTNDAWYYVLGRTSGNYTFDKASTGVANVLVTTVKGDSSVVPVGSMACLWCDQPSAVFSSEEESNVKSLVENLATNNAAYFTAAESSEDTPAGGDLRDAQGSGTLSEEVTSDDDLLSGQKYVIAGSSGDGLSHLAAGERSNFLDYEGNVASSGVSGNAIWTITAVSGGYYVQNSEGNYLNLNSGSATVSDHPQILNLRYSTTEGAVGWRIYYSTGHGPNLFYLSSDENYAGSKYASNENSRLISRWKLYGVEG